MRIRLRDDPEQALLNIHDQLYQDVRVLSPAGRIDHSNSSEFLKLLHPYVERCKKDGESLVIDLGKVDYISSAGLRCFMLAEKQATTHGGVIVVSAMQPVVREIFEISRFTLVFETFVTVREAIAKLSPAALKAYDVQKGS
jgi:anti-sigma B factor antagonist